MDCFNLGLKGLNQHFLKFIQAEIRCPKKNPDQHSGYLCTKSIYLPRVLVKISKYINFRLWGSNRATTRPE